jgi:hypothetical protein
VGGWEWQPRLASSDMLNLAIEKNPMFQQYLNDAGMSSYDHETLDQINLH